MNRTSSGEAVLPEGCSLKNCAYHNFTLAQPSALSKIKGKHVPKLSPSIPIGPGWGVSPFFKQLWMYAAFHLAYFLCWAFCRREKAILTTPANWCIQTRNINIISTFSAVIWHPFEYNCVKLIDELKKIKITALTRSQHERKMQRSAV